MDFVHRTTHLAVAALQDASKGIPKDAKPYDIRTAGLTRPAYSRFARSLSGNGQASSRGSARGMHSARSASGAYSARSLTRTNSARRSESGMNSEVDGFLSSRSSLIKIESSVPMSVFARYERSRENRALAEQEKEERLQRDDVREELSRQLHDEMQDKRSKMRSKQEHAKREHMARVALQGQFIRQQRIDIEDEIELNRQDYLDKMRGIIEQVSGGFGPEVNARLAMQEEEARQELKEEVQAQRYEQKEDMKAARRRQLLSNRETVKTLRETIRLSESLAAQQQRNKEAAAAQRAHTARVQERIALNEEEYQAMAREARARTVARKEKAATARDELTKRRKGEIALNFRTRANRYAGMVETKGEVLLRNAGIRDKVFASRFISSEQAERFEGSAFRKLHYMDNKADEQIDRENEQLVERIANMEMRVDAEIDDDAAGEARKRFAEKSKEQKRRRTARLRKANTQLRNAISQAEPVTDSIMDQEAAAVRRKEMATEALARREADAAELKEKNREMNKRLQSVSSAWFKNPFAWFLGGEKEAETFEDQKQLEQADSTLSESSMAIHASSTIAL